MVYVNSNGDIGEKRFSIIEFFWKIFYFITFFFRSLIGPLMGDQVQYDPDSQARFRSFLGNGRGAGGGGGSGLWPGRPGGGSGGPRRPMGRLNTSGPSNMPSCPSGGCCG